MDARICASIAASTMSEMERKIEQALGLGADLVELRLDYLSEINVNAVSATIRRFGGRVIVTLRPSWEGGRFDGGEGERARMLSEIAEFGPAYVDIELDAPNLGEVAEKLREKTSLIISKHDLDGSLNIGELRAAVSRALKLGKIAKVVTTAKTISHNLKILSLYRDFPPGRLIAFAMGELGIISRILSPLIGAPIAYACLPGEAVAPGQLTIGELREFLELVRGR